MWLRLTASYISSTFSEVHVMESIDVARSAIARVFSNAAGCWLDSHISLLHHLNCYRSANEITWQTTTSCEVIPMTGCAGKLYTVPTYPEEAEIPFVPDGSSPIIGGCVERVKGISPPFVDLMCVRKTIVGSVSEMAEDVELRKRILAHEAKVLFTARHRHVVEVLYAYFRQSQGFEDFAIVMQRADRNLGQHLLYNEPKAQWFGCLVNAVCHIHELGIRHRDIKPSNILIKNGDVLLADFGISQMGLGKTMPTTYEYRDSSRTRQYCAPEVDDGSTRGRSADIFSLGAVFLEMLVAYCRPDYRTSLAGVLKPSKWIISSYAKHVDSVQVWVEEYLITRLNGTWKGELSTLCTQMLRSDRRIRPLAIYVKERIYNLKTDDECLHCKCTPIEPVRAEQAFLQACREGSVDEVVRLINDGINPDCLGAIHLAAEGGHVAIVNTLLSAGIHVDSLNTAMQTALQCAVRNGHEHVVKVLLSHKCNVNTRDDQGRTPLQGAAAHGSGNVVHLLLQHGADVLAEDRWSDTAIDFASRRRHDHIVDMLSTVSLHNQSAQHVIMCSA